MTIAGSGPYFVDPNPAINVTAVGSVTGGVVITCDVNHGYSNGDAVAISGTTDYNGIWYVSGVFNQFFEIIQQVKVEADDQDEPLAFTTSQTGTVRLVDDPSGLIGLTGVTAFQRGGQTVIDIGANYFQIQANAGLVIDPELYEIVSEGANNRVMFANGSNARLYLGRAYLLDDGYVRNTKGTALRTGDAPVWFRPGTNPGDYGAVCQKSGSILVWRGATVVCPDSGYSIDDGCKTRIRDGVCISGQGNAPSLRGVISSFHNADCILKGFRHVGGELIFGTDSDSAVPDGLLREESAFAVFPNRIPSITLPNPDYGNKGNVLDVPIQSEGVSLTRTTCLDSSTGNNLIMIGGENNTDSRNKGYNRIIKRIQVGLFDALNTPLEGGKFFIRDTDNGQRKNLNSEDDTADKTYAGTFGVDGFAPETQVITGIVNVAGSNPRGVSNQAQYRMDFRGKFDSTESAPNIPDNTAEFDLNVYQYGFTPAALPRTLIGNGLLTLRETAQPNLNTTETDTAVVAAYATLDTAVRIKDRADLFLLDNFGTYLSFIVGRSGAQVNLSDGLASIMTIDSGAAQVFDYDGTDTVTVLSNTCEAGAVGGTVNVEGATTIQNARFDSDVNYNSSITTLTNITCTGTLTLQPGTYSFINCNISNIAGGPSVIINPDSATVISNNVDGVTVNVIQRLLTITNVPSGGILEIYDDDDVPNSPVDLGTLLQTTNPTTGSDVTFSHSKAGDNIFICFLHPDYVEENIPLDLENQDQNFNLANAITLETN